MQATGGFGGTASTGSAGAAGTASAAANVSGVGNVTRRLARRRRRRHRRAGTPEMGTGRTAAVPMPLDPARPPPLTRRSLRPVRPAGQGAAAKEPATMAAQAGARRHPPTQTPTAVPRRVCHSDRWRRRSRQQRCQWRRRRKRKLVDVVSGSTTGVLGSINSPPAARAATAQIRREARVGMPPPR